MNSNTSFDVQLVPPFGELLLNITSCLILSIGPIVCEHDVICKTGSA